MKNIYFVRHAKAVHDGTPDFDRGLETRGQMDANIMAMHLKARAEHIDKIISSPAKRTMQTAKIFANVLGLENKIKKVEKLYATTPGTIIEVINELKDKWENVVIVAHNNEITEVCEILSDASIASIPTSGIYAISFDLPSFKSIEPHSGTTLFFDFPKKDK